ncbi:MAG: hypothetical protein HFJ29_09645 [Clostridia bacterium]|nr:hypothetical protein [Clostridia bacterium]
MIFEAVEHLVVRDNKLASDETPKIFVRKNSSFVKLFVEYWDYEWGLPLISTWNDLSLEVMVGLGREGLGSVKRTKIPWETRAREICHTFLGGSEYAYYDEPAPEKIRYSYLKDFKEILRMNVHRGVRAETKYENGREIGFTLFIDEQHIINLPFEIDWERVERWTGEEEKQFREKEEMKKKVKNF